LAYLELADLDAAEYDEARSGLWTRGLLIRRAIADGDRAFFTTWCPARTEIQRLVLVEGHRWAIEDSFKTIRNELGLDHNETRSWHGWHRHVSLVMLAFAFAFAMMAATSRVARHARDRDDGGDPPSGKPGTAPKKIANDAAPLIRWSIQEVRRIAVRLAQRRTNPRTPSPGRLGEGHIHCVWRN